jgi:serine phosphatase RsbU (regulator of sigma subunit)
MSFQQPHSAEAAIQIRQMNTEAKALRAKEPKRAIALIEHVLLLIGERDEYAKEKADALLSLGIAKRMSSEFKAAIVDFQNAQACYEQLDDKEGIAESLNNIGLMHHFLGEYAVAFETFQRSRALCEEIGFLWGLASALNNIGGFYYDIADYPQSLEYHQQSLAIRQRINDAHGIAVSLNNLGSVYFDLDDFENARHHFEQSLSIRQEIDDKRGMATSLNNLGNVYSKEPDYHKALEYYRQSLDLLKTIGDKRGIAFALNNSASSYSNLKEYETALSFYEQSLALRQSINDNLGTVTSLMDVGATLVNLSRYDEAEAMLKKALALATEHGIGDTRYKIHKHLATLYAKTQQFEKAYLAHIEYHNAEKEVFSREKQKRLAMTQARFETEQAKRQAELNQKETEIFKLKNIDLVAFKESITSSIEYASRIQNAVLPFDERISQSLNEWFVIYKPQAIVSGDFYWFQDFGAFKLAIVGDCTGHGVPGAFMSLLGLNFLNQIIIERGVKSPNQILLRLHRSIQRALKQEKKSDALQDGMDVCVVRIEPDKLIFAGAKRPLFIAKAEANAAHQVLELKGDRFSIGGSSNAYFTNQELPISEKQMMYLTTDGISDMGNDKKETFGKKRLRELLGEIASMTIAEQKNTLEHIIQTYQAHSEQRDDITVFGIALNMPTSAADNNKKAALETD